MPLLLSEEQQLLQDATRGFLADKAPVSELRKLRDSADATGYSTELWGEMAEMGWAGILVPEEHGGLGFGAVGAGIVMEEMGRTLTASPMLSTAIVGASLIARGGSDAQKAEFLPKIAAGELTTALAVDEGPHHGPCRTSLAAEPSGNGFKLTGDKSFVVDGHVADRLAVAARTSGEAGETDGISLFLVDREADGVTVERTIMVDSRNAARINFNAVQVSGDDILGAIDAGFEVLDGALDLGRACLAAELTGVARESFERTVGYLKERQQFGTAIGAFQSLQHRAAHVYSEIELARSITLKALQAIDAGDPAAARLASTAKAKVGAVARLATNEAVQMYGGIGMTDEFDIGFFMKRARVADELYGDGRFHADRFAELSAY
ncbi:MAG: acyl-CoA dehydrogenase family protein [Sphingomonadales bacterium]|nr:acyl-CoA dehydrogenase family protein [Sphingomonadales bacterium]